jgi:hypothetical protein
MTEVDQLRAALISLGGRQPCQYEIEIAADKLILAIIEHTEKEIWGFIEHITDCPYFDGVNKDSNETFLSYTCLPEQVPGEGPLNAGTIRTKTLKEAITEFANAMGAFEWTTARSTKKSTRS